MVQHESATVVDDVYNTARHPTLKATARKTGPNTTEAPQDVWCHSRSQSSNSSRKTTISSRLSMTTLHLFSDTNSVSRRLRDQANARMDDFRT
jgi:hypothetical protein